MKKLILIFTGIVFTLMPLTEISAQSKVAHINTQELISEMPEVISAQKELKKLEEQYAKELESSVKEFQTKAQTGKTQEELYAEA
jgi:outer membrane protein